MVCPFAPQLEQALAAYNKMHAAYLAATAVWTCSDIARDLVAVREAARLHKEAVGLRARIGRG